MAKIRLTSGRRDKTVMDTEGKDKEVETTRKNATDKE